MLRETSQSRKDKRDTIPLTGGPGGVSFIETDSRTVGATGWRGEGAGVQRGQSFSPEMQGQLRDSVTCLMPPNCTLRAVRMVTFRLRILSHNKKEKKRHSDREPGTDLYLLRLEAPSLLHAPPFQA